MSKIASAAGVAVTHREREDRPGDFRRSDAVRAAMEEAALQNIGKSPSEVKKAVHAARNRVMGRDES